jgi:[ribosomal protein S5]-alanine N-acetyltransferase
LILLKRYKKIETAYASFIPSKMKTTGLQIDRLLTQRLMLVPFTMQICKNLLNEDFSDVLKMGFKKGISWPDEDVKDTLPRIINNLSKVESPTGFESWMIVKSDTLEVIGDLGFKGFNEAAANVDIGYGIIKEERRKGYAEEAITALINWAFLNDRVKEITAQCLIDNIGSINLLQKFNFIKIKKDTEMIYWSLQKKQ